MPDGSVSGLTYAVAGGVAVLWTAVWGVSLLGLYTARKKYLNRPIPSSPLLSPSHSDSLPGVTILRPLCGLDSNLYYNLRSTLTLSYPSSKLEILFCVQDANDPAVEVVNMLLDERDEAGNNRWEELGFQLGKGVRVVVSGREDEVGVNPKINNLVKPVREAKYDILWVVDATISLGEGMLARSVEALITPPGGKKAGRLEDADSRSLLADQQKVLGTDSRLEHSAEYSGVGLVHHLPHAWVPNTSGQGTFGSRLEACYLNGVHGRMYLAINAFGTESCVVGKSCLYRKSSINALHAPSPPSSSTSNPTGDLPLGLPAFAPFLPEDNLIAHGIMHQLHLQHAMTPDLAMDCLGPMTIRDYVARRVRWIRVRRRMVWIATMVEPLTESLLLGLVASWAAKTIFGLTRVGFFAVHELAWIVMDLLVVSALRGQKMGLAETVDWLYVWGVREALALPIWVKAICGGNQVVWRGVKYRIVKNGEAVKDE